MSVFTLLHNGLSYCCFSAFFPILSFTMSGLTGLTSIANLRNFKQNMFFQCSTVVENLPESSLTFRFCFRRKSPSCVVPQPARNSSLNRETRHRQTNKRRVTKQKYFVTESGSFQHGGILFSNHDEEKAFQKP